MIHDGSQQCFDFSIFLFVISNRTRARRSSLSDCQNLQTIAMGLVQKVTADPHWLLCPCGSSCPRCQGKTLSITGIPKCALAATKPSQRPGQPAPCEWQPWGPPATWGLNSVSDQDKPHMMWLTSGIASPMLALLSEDVHSKNGGITVLRTSKHHRKPFPSSMPVIWLSCSVTSTISLVFIADRQKSSSSKDFSRHFFFQTKPDTGPK